MSTKMCSYTLLSFLFFCKIVISRDYYAGMFSKNDFLIAQDQVFKERVPYRTVIANYGRYFKCPITYFRVLDRLGVGNGPRVQITRGGLRHRFIVLRLTSPYNYPISVSVYVGCENKNKSNIQRKITTTTAKGSDASTTAASASDLYPTSKPATGSEPTGTAEANGTAVPTVTAVPTGTADSNSTAVPTGAGNSTGSADPTGSAKSTSSVDPTGSTATSSANPTEITEPTTAAAPTIKS